MTDSPTASSRPGEFTLPVVPGHLGPVRASAQSRLGQYVAFLALYAGAASLLEALFGWFSPALRVFDMRWHAASLPVLGVLWLGLRLARLSDRALVLIDFGVTWGLCALFCYNLFNGHVPFRQDIEVTLNLPILLVIRSGLVPSTGRRTLVISLGCVVLFLLGLVRLRLMQPPPPFIPDGRLIVGTTVFALQMALVTAMMSDLLHGLRQQIQRAMRLGQYTLGEKLGEGGMGIVYRARHALLRRPTAIKLLSQERAGQTALARFEREVQLTCRLSHPHIISLYDFGHTPDGVFYYAMEYLEGIDLEVLVRREGALPAGRVLHILTQAASALAEAHAAGLIHRDIKPANLMLCEYGGQVDFLKVLDFGLVREVARPQSTLTLAEGQSLPGTPLYMAPEVFQSPERLDARSDLYSLGATAYYLLTGQPLFSGSPTEVYLHHLHTAPEPPSRWGRPVPARLEQVVLTCLEKDPARRPASALALLEQLAACQDVEPWTLAQAQAWWAEHRPRLVPATSEEPTPAVPRSGVSMVHALTSVPTSADPTHDLLQRRMSQFLIFLFLNWAPGAMIELYFWLVAAPLPFMEYARMYWFTICAIVAAWLWMRRRERSEVALYRLEAAMTLGPMAWYCYNIVNHKVRVPPEAMMYLLLMVLLVGRAALIPVTARRSAVVGGLAAGILFTGSWYLNTHHGRSPEAPPVVVALTWLARGLLLTAITTLVSRTVHGLRQQARRALRLGQYTLEEKLGEGGMGIVYRARHALLRRPTAIKLLRPERAGERAIARFEREARLTSRLSHPNTIALYDYGRTPEGLFYYAMEYLDGEDLERLVHREGPQPASRVVHILSQAASALAEAHAAGLVHRDIKPSNLMLCQRVGQPDFLKVLDFGLGREVQGGEEAITQGEVPMLGTPLYMAPEAIVSPAAVEPRSDLYALGAVGYFLLTGQPVFSGRSSVEVCAHHLHSPVEPPSSRLGRPVPAGLEQLILSCLEKEPARRPPSATALLERLALCREESMQGPPSPIAPARREARG